MAEWLIFVNTPYYPYVANDWEEAGDGTMRYLPVVADSPQEALKMQKESIPTDNETTVFVAPWNGVAQFNCNSEGDLPRG